MPLRRLLCWEGFYWRSPWRVFIGNAVASRTSSISGTCLDATFTFTEKAIVVPPDGDADYRPGNRSRR
ncbi:hypothetical protein LN650_01035 [Klebsiella pneumoniae subsp. pneumoniae]|nr:hypothetical protein [Klebsiella pneumoniae subsp. pneumoniae]